ICLNITRWSHTNVFASATARPFELAAYGACIVSQPYNGIEEWFEVGKELVVVQSEKEALEAYSWLLESDYERQVIGERARERIFKVHTYHNRASQIIDVLRSKLNDRVNSACLLSSHEKAIVKDGATDRLVNY
ncbi:MAG: glycosyltransferase family protein, partial [Bacillota bacterium]